MALTAGSVTIKLAGGDYSTWAAFWDDIGNLTGNITCTVDASAFTEAAGPGAVNESLNNHTLHVLPASFPSTTDASTGARFTFNTTDPVLNMQMEGGGSVIIEGMVKIEGTSEPLYGIIMSTINAAFNLVYRRNIIKGCTVGIYQNDTTMDATTKIYNNIVYDTSINCINFNVAVPNALISNNTVHNGVNNINCGTVAITLENTLSYAPALGACYQQIATAAVGNNNADSDNTGEDADWGGGGANNVPGISDPFNNVAADDFTISQLGVIGTAGKDLSGDFTDDFFGTTRTRWTIGACEATSNPTEVVSALIEVEAIGIQALKQVAIALIEIEAIVTGSQALIREAAALVEVEAAITGNQALIRAVSALVEVEAAVTGIKSRIEAALALIEVEAAIPGKWDATGEVAALVEMEADIGALAEYVRSFGGSLTPTGSLSNILTIIMALGGTLDLFGAVTTANPSWLLLDDTLRWMGEWDVATYYDLHDTVLYKSPDGNEWHVFVSKITHNVGNIPTSTAFAWRRLYQEKML